VVCLGKKLQGGHRWRVAPSRSEGSSVVNKRTAAAAKRRVGGGAAADWFERRARAAALARSVAPSFLFYFFSYFLGRISLRREAASGRSIEPRTPSLQVRLQVVLRWCAGWESVARCYYSPDELASPLLFLLLFLVRPFESPTTTNKRKNPVLPLLPQRSPT